jgi:hypothetical protein
MPGRILFCAVERAKAYRFLKYAVGGSQVPFRSLVADIVEMQRLRSLGTRFRERARGLPAFGRSPLAALLAARPFVLGETDPARAADSLDSLHAASSAEGLLGILAAQGALADPAQAAAFQAVAREALPDERAEEAERFLLACQAELAPLGRSATDGKALWRIAARTLEFAARAGECWVSPGASLADLVPAIYHQQCQYFFEKCDSIPPALRVAPLVAVEGLPVPGAYFSSTVARHLVEHLSQPLDRLLKAAPAARRMPESALAPAVTVALEAATYAQRHGMDLWESRGVEAPQFS